MKGKLSPVKEQITLTVAKLAGTNAVFVAEDVLKVLEDYRDALKDAGFGFIITRDYGKRANDAVNELVQPLSSHNHNYSCNVGVCSRI